MQLYTTTLSGLCVYYPIYYSARAMASHLVHLSLLFSLYSDSNSDGTEEEGVVDRRSVVEMLRLDDNGVLREISPFSSPSSSASSSITTSTPMGGKATNGPSSTSQRVQERFQALMQNAFVPLIDTSAKRDGQENSSALSEKGGNSERDHGANGNDNEEETRYFRGDEALAAAYERALAKEPSVGMYLLYCLEVRHC